MVTVCAAAADADAAAAVAVPEATCIAACAQSHSLHDVAIVRCMQSEALNQSSERLDAQQRWAKLVVEEPM